MDGKKYTRCALSGSIYVGRFAVVLNFFLNGVLCKHCAAEASVNKALSTHNPSAATAFHRKGAPELRTAFRGAERQQPCREQRRAARHVPRSKVWSFLEPSRFHGVYPGEPAWRGSPRQIPASTPLPRPTSLHVLISPSRPLSHTTIPRLQ